MQKKAQNPEEQMTQTEEEYLKSYNAKEFPTPLITVDIVIFSIRNKEVNVLLVKRGTHPNLGKWALPGGFIDQKYDQNLMDAATRKLKGKTGVQTPYLEQLETLGSHDRDPRGWSVTVAYFALINSDDVSLVIGETESDVQWYPIKRVKHPLAFDHSNILETAYQRLQAKVEYTALPVHMLGDEFTLSDLKSVFEIILERKVEKSAFRRRIKDAQILEEIPGKMRGGSNRPAQLYRLKDSSRDFFFKRTLMGPRE